MIDKRGLQQSLETLKQDQLKLKVGQLAPTELTSQKSQVASQRVTVINDQNTYHTDYQTLLTSLGLNPNVKLNLDMNIVMPNIKIPDRNAAVKVALAHNTTYLTDLVNYQIDKRALLVAKDKRRWTLDATATAPLKTGGAQKDTDKSVALDLTIPIDDVSAKQGEIDAEVKIQQDKINLANAKRTVVTDVINALTQVNMDKKEIALAEESVRLSQETYNAAQIKYKHGLIDNFEVSQRQTDLLTEENSLVTDKISYLNGIDSLYQTLGTFLDFWGINLKY